MADAATAAGGAALEVSGMTKTFGGRTALADFDLVLEAGEIHAIVGQNGCGKSTLVKCLSGFHEPDAGTVSVAGTRLASGYGSRDASRAGLRFVHQDLGIVAGLTVTENLGLGRGYLTGPSGRIQWRRENARAAGVLASANCEGIAADAPASTLSLTAHAMIAIARAVGSADAGAKVIVLDEPSASLPEDDVAILHESIRSAAANGAAVLLVSHRMSEVFELADAVTVMRDGRKVGTYRTDGLEEGRLAELIVGGALTQAGRAGGSSVELGGTSRLTVRGLAGGTVRGLDLDVAPGEIVGLAGLRGSGRSTLARLLAGVQPAVAGTVAVDGVERGEIASAEERRRAIVYVPEERKTHGVVAGLTVLENLLLPRLGSFRTRLGRLDRARMRRVGHELVHEYGVRPPDIDAPISSLSGGNQQKVVLARWFSLAPKVAVLDEPFQGIDIGAKNEIFSIIAGAAASGVSVLMIDSDFENLSRICDRILVMHLGRVVEEISGERVARHDDVAHAVLLAHMDMGMESAR